MPISRFLDSLRQERRYEEYMETLVNAFNPATAAGVMCRNTLSVGWDGSLYDCDFNQMLEIAIEPEVSGHIKDFDLEQLTRRQIMLDRHCYSCTAGAGSSCAGEIT